MILTYLELGELSTLFLKYNFLKYDLLIIAFLNVLVTYKRVHRVAKFSLEVHALLNTLFQISIKLVYEKEIDL